MSFRCDPCRKVLAGKDTYTKHCASRLHILVTSGTPLEEARRIRDRERGEKISVANMEHAKTHTNPRKGVTPTKDTIDKMRATKTKDMPKLNETHPHLVQQWHPSKNGAYTPDMFTANSNFPAWWLCLNTCSHGCPHEYMATIGNRANNGSECPYCARKKCCIHTSIVCTHPEVAAEYSESNDVHVSEILWGSHKPRTWECSKTTCPRGCKHIYKTSPLNRCKPGGSGCPFCARQQICKHMSIAYTHPDVSVEWSSKNSDSPTDYSHGSSHKADWVCKRCKHEYSAEIKNRCGNRSGCPVCKRKTQKRVYLYLRELFPHVRAEDPMVPKRKLDFVIQELNLVVEVDGLQHFRDLPYWKSEVSIVRSIDVAKMKYVIDKGYRVIRISQQDIFDNPSRDWLDTHLLPYLTPRGDTVVYIYPSNPTRYDAHQRLMDVGSSSCRDDTMPVV